MAGTEKELVEVPWSANVRRGVRHCKNPAAFPLSSFSETTADNFPQPDGSLAFTLGVLSI